MTQPADTITVATSRVSCDGSGGALGHPRIYLEIKPEAGRVECPYCSRLYVLKAGAKAAAGH